MKKLLFVLLFLLILPISSSAQEKKSFIYFYADWCSYCQKVNEFFQKNEIYKMYNVEKLNFDEPENKTKLLNLFQEKNYLKQAGIPTILIDDQILSGDQDIISYFQNQFPEKKTKEKTSEDKTGGLNIPIWVLIGAAFVDASNPCAIAVLVLLLATVINAKGKKYALLSGFMFSLAIFSSYFLMGIGVYKAIGAFGIPRYLSLGVGILAVILGLANLKDVFWYGRVFIMEVPLSWRPKMQEIIKKATSPWSAFGIGFLVSLFLVPCASGPYVVILGMLAKKVNMTNALMLLVLYNLIFVLPMILISLAMYFLNARMGKIEEWRKNNLRWLHLIASVILLILGFYLIFNKL